MQKKLLLYTIIGALFTSLVGTLSHFTYEWSNQNLLVGLITPVSESTWEHMKLLFFPMLFYFIFTWKYMKQDCPCISYAYPWGILAGTFAIPIFFYSYSGILGRNYTPIDIMIFYISVILAFTVVYRKTLSCQKKDIYLGKNSVLPWFLVLLLTACFFVFTIFPPALEIFKSY